eukprot:11010890-Lingulodinium_polyedra.AAC.1
MDINKGTIDWSRKGVYKLEVTETADGNYNVQLTNTIMERTVTLEPQMSVKDYGWDSYELHDNYS